MAAVAWQSLVANLAVVALFISAWVHGQFIFTDLPRRVRAIAFGIVMGLGSIASMMLAIEVEPGRLFDLRLSLLAIATFFGGPVAGLLAGGMAAAYRLLVGGSGMLIGVSTIAVAVGLGLLVSWLGRRFRLHAVLSATMLALAVAGLNLFIVASFSGPQVPGSIMLPSSVMLALATLISAFFILRHSVVRQERDLLRAAFVRSPDYQYVKSADRRFVAVNENVLRMFGASSARELIGKTEEELLPGDDRTASIRRTEEELLSSGRSIVDVEEKLVDPDGVERWLTSTKVPIQNSDGETIGLVGSSNDISARKRHEQDIAANRNQLHHVLTEMTDGIAMFDPDGTLVYCNAQYQRLFPRTAELRRPGQSLRTILEQVVARREQVLPAGNEARWIDEITGSLLRESEEEVELFDGRWLHVRTRPTADGAALVMVSDVTKVKHAEAALRSLAEQLRQLATTDGLTGLTNRRAFDEALETEIARARRDGKPLSLLLIDADRFKAFNDVYGHPAGDAALKTIGGCLRRAVRRATDVVARYGGEEFVAILPDTDEDGAFIIADAFLDDLKALAVPHRGSEKGVVTASVGIATLRGSDAGMTSVELVRRADEALYNAKEAGRDKVMIWRPSYDVRQVDGMRA